MKIKPINKLEDDDLLSRINSSKPTAITKINNVGFFIAHYNIRKGNYLVGIQLLYRLYKNWSAAMISYAAFKTEIKQYFLIYKKDYVHISLDAIKVTKETIKFLLEKEQSIPIKEHKSIEEFISFNNLIEGKKWVEAGLLYKICTYQTQLLKNSTLHIGQIDFVNYLKVHFPYKYTTKHLFRLSEVNYELLKKEEERHKVWKEEQKSKNTIRRAKARIKFKNPLR